MALERERKFLVRRNLLPEDFFNRDKVRIKQGYIISNREEELRIRIVENTHALITYKQYTSDLTVRKEFESIINLPVAEEMYNSMHCMNRIEKDRYQYDGWEVDIYDNQEFIIAEREYENEETFPKKLPIWIGQEVTGLMKYSNAVLAV